MCDSNSIGQGQARLITFGGHIKTVYVALKFEVLDKVTNVLGLKTTVDTKLVKHIDRITTDTFGKCADTFTGFDCISDVEYHIKTKASQVVYPPC